MSDLPIPPEARRAILRVQPAWRQKYEAERLADEADAAIKTAMKPLVRRTRDAFRRALPRGAWAEWTGAGWIRDFGERPAVKLYLAARVRWRGLMCEVAEVVTSTEDATALGWRLAGALLAWDNTSPEKNP